MKRLLTRSLRLTTELADVERRIAAIEGADILVGTVGERVVAFLTTNPTITFSPAEIMDAIRAAEETTRKVLSVLHQTGVIVHTKHGRYQAAEETTRKVLQAKENLG